MADLRYISVVPPERGLETASGPSSDSTTAPVYRNFLPSYPGKVVPRGPLTWPTPVKLSGGALNSWPMFITGMVTAAGVTLLGLAEKSAKESEGFVSPWQAPFAAATAASQLMHAKSTAYKYTGPSALFNEPLVAEEISTPLLQGEPLGEFAYYLAFQGPSTRKTNLSGRIQWTNQICTWNGVRIGSPARSPAGSQFLKVHLERLWAFGGTDPTAPTKDEEAIMSSAATSSKPTESRKGLLVKSKSIYDRMEIGDKILASTGSINLVGATITALNGYSESPSAGYEIILSVYTTNETGLPEVATYTNVKFEHVKGPKVQANALYYSEQEGPLGASAWTTTSPISGIVEVNKIVVGAENSNDFLVGGAVVNQNLLIFKRNSIWYLTGYSPETFNLRQLTGERGCLDPWSICEANGGAYFLSQAGFEFFDGSEFHLIDEVVKNTARVIARLQSTNNSFKPSRCQIEYVGNDYLMINAVAVQPNTFELIKEMSGLWLYHTKSGNWAELTSSAFGGSGTVVACNADRGDHVPWVFDGEYLNAIPYLTKPDDTTVTFDTTPASGKAKIPAEYETNRIDLTNGGSYTSQIHRFLMDYAAPLNSGTDASAESVIPWEVTIYDDSGNVLNPKNEPYKLAAHGAKATTKYIEGRRFESDTFSEAVSGVKMKVVATGNPTEGLKGEIYEATLEVQTARQRRKI